MSEDSAIDSIPLMPGTSAIEYEPVSPEKRRSAAAALVVIGLILGGIGGWLLRDFIDSPPQAVVIGQASEFSPGSVTEVVLDAGHFDPYPLESPTAEASAGSELSETRLFVVSDPRGGLVALSQRSPWLGCRMTVVTRAAALDFGHAVQSAFESGFLDPCHGGLYSLDGEHLAGPGDRALNRFSVGYLPNGSVVVDLTDVQVA